MYLHLGSGSFDLLRSLQRQAASKLSCFAGIYFRESSVFESTNLIKNQRTGEKTQTRITTTTMRLKEICGIFAKRPTKDIHIRI